MVKREKFRGIEAFSYPDTYKSEGPGDRSLEKEALRDAILSTIKLIKNPDEETRRSLTCARSWINGEDHTYVADKTGDCVVLLRSVQPGRGIDAAEVLCRVLAWPAETAWYAVTHTPCLLVRHLYKPVAQHICEKLKGCGWDVTVTDARSEDPGPVPTLMGGKHFVMLDKQKKEHVAAFLSEILGLPEAEAEGICKYFPCIIAKDLEPSTAERISSTLVEHYGVKSSIEVWRI